VLDRCNGDNKDRKYWYELAMKPNDAVIVYFTTSVSDCVARANMRENHPTIAKGKAENIVKSHAKTFVPPSNSSDGWASRIISVASANEALTILFGI
jgi:atypical dual specificity phosphatase